MLSKKQIIEAMFTDLDAYKEYMEEWLEEHLERHPEKVISWSAWFEGATGKDLEDADRGIPYNKGESMLEELRKLTVAESKRTLSRRELRRYLFLVEELQKDKIEIPFGIEI